MKTLLTRHRWYGIRRRSWYHRVAWNAGSHLYRVFRKECNVFKLEMRYPNHIGVCMFDDLKI